MPARGLTSAVLSATTRSMVYSSRRPPSVVSATVAASRYGIEGPESADAASSGVMPGATSVVEAACRVGSIAADVDVLPLRVNVQISLLSYAVSNKITSGISTKIADMECAFDLEAYDTVRVIPHLNMGIGQCRRRLCGECTPHRCRLGGRRAFFMPRVAAGARRYPHYCLGSPLSAPR